MQKNHSELNDEMMDAQSIFIYKAIKRINPSLQILTELSYSSNIDFLLPKSKKNTEYTFSTLYAAGEVYIAATIDTITAQAFYNPHVITILQQILVGKGEKTAKDDIEADIIANFGEKLSQSNLWQIMVPDEFINKTYDKLFKFLLNEKKLVALGLYRLPGANDNSYPYCYTNPDMKNTNVTARDRVFVLGKEIPKDLQLVINQNSGYNSASGGKGGSNGHHQKGNKRFNQLGTDEDGGDRERTRSQANPGIKFKDYYGIRRDSTKQPSLVNNKKRNDTSLSASSRKDILLPRAVAPLQLDTNYSNLNLVNQGSNSHIGAGNMNLLPQGNDLDRMANKFTPFSDKGSMLIPSKNDKDKNMLTNPIDFMNGALLRIENKITELERKVLMSKEILMSQEGKIKTEVINAKREVLLNDSGNL